MNCLTPRVMKPSRKGSLMSPLDSNSDIKKRAKSFRQTGPIKAGSEELPGDATILSRLSQKAKDRKEKLGFLDFISLKREAMGQSKSGMTLGEALNLDISVKTEMLVRKCARRFKNIAQSKVIAKKLLLNDLSFLSKEGSRLTKAIQNVTSKEDDADPRDEYLTLKKLKVIEPLAKQHSTKIFKHMTPSENMFERQDEFKIRMNARKKEKLDRLREARKKLSNYDKHVRVIEARDQLSNEIMDYVSKNFEDPTTIRTLVEEDCTSRDLAGIMKKHQGIFDSVREQIFSDRKYQIRVRTLPNAKTKNLAQIKSYQAVDAEAGRKKEEPALNKYQRSSSKKIALIPMRSSSRSPTLNKPGGFSKLAGFSNAIRLLKSNSKNKAAARIKNILETVSFSSQVHSPPEAECQSHFETRLNRLYNQVSVISSKISDLEKLPHSHESRMVLNYLIDKRKSTADSIIKTNKKMLK